MPHPIMLANHNGDAVLKDAVKANETLEPWLVELEGGLLPQALFWEAFLHFVKKNPLRLFLAFLWAVLDRKKLKNAVFESAGFSMETLPYHPALCASLQEEHDRGRPLVLVARIPMSLAQQAADVLGVFSHVYSVPQKGQGSPQNENDRGFSDWWQDTFGSEAEGALPFTYVCEGAVHQELFSLASDLIFVHQKKNAQPAKRTPLLVHPRVQEKGPALLKALRLHQWAKNALLFIPLLLAHRWQEVWVFAEVLLGFISFGLCASSVYVLNDLLDVVADRKHHRKKTRPFASGALSVPMGFFLIGFLLPMGATLAYMVSPAFMTVMAIYYGTTVGYSFWFKQIAMVDVLVLAGLYTIRLVAGAAAASVTLSFWLVAFSLFFFLNLALVKRFTEMVTLGSKNGPEAGKVKAAGRGYCADDAPLLRSLGIAAGYISVLILALYLDSDQVKRLYQAPQMLWGMVPLFVYWISRNWLLASREKMHDDPIVFALKDSVSYLVAAGLALFLFLAM
jgi:4-hydroxybenzoate polyprenyltransferase